MEILLLKHLKGVNVIASNKSTPVIAFSFKKNIFGLQFHPEVTHTDQGKKLFIIICLKYVNRKNYGQ